MHPRYPVRRNCLIFDSKGAVGNVKDISLGGLSFNSIYTISNQENGNTMGLLFEQDTYVDKMNFIIASTAPVQKDFQFSSINVYRYGVKLENLTPRQKSDLEAIISQCRQAA